MIKSRFRLVKTLDEVTELISCIKKTGLCSFDFETTSFKFWEEEEYPTVIGISFQPGSAWVIPLAHEESSFLNKGTWVKILKLLGKEVFDNPDIIKVGHNLKFEMKWLYRFNIPISGYLFDTMLAKHLLDENTPNDLKTLVSMLIPEMSGYESEITMLTKKWGWSKTPLKPLATYCGKDADFTLRCMLYLEDRLISSGLYGLFRNSSMMATRVLAESEFNGILVDRPYLETLIDKYSNLISETYEEVVKHPTVIRFIRKSKKLKIKTAIKEVKAEIKKIREEKPSNMQVLVGNRIQKIMKMRNGELSKKQEFEFNLQSPKQMAAFFFDSKMGLGLPITKYTESGAPSTDDSVLQELKKIDTTGFMARLEKYRELSKLFSTYIMGIHNILPVDNRIRAKFNIHGTVTGRYSSSDPNMQNIPRVTTNPDIKKMFLPNPGQLILEVDYAQAELRVVAEYAQEKEMLRWFKEGISAHVAVAAKAEGADYETVYAITKDKTHPDYMYWTKRKKRAKTINFGILYGQTGMKLSETLNTGLKDGEEKVTPQEAEQFKAEWFEMFPRIKRWIKGQEEFVKENGYVTNMFGRKRRLHKSIDTYFENLSKRWSMPKARWRSIAGSFSEALRQSVNTPIQGTSADLTNLAAIVIWEYRQRGDLPYNMYQLYTVHDSIGYSIDPGDIHKVEPLIKAICAQPDTDKYFNFKIKQVTMKVSPEIGKNWGELEEYDKETEYN